MTDTPDPKLVFLIHGRDDIARDATNEFLAALGIATMPWREAKALASRRYEVGSPTILQIVMAGMAVCQGLVVLFTPDDFAHLREDLWRIGDGDQELRSRGQPRQNVLFEAGAAMALFPERTVIVEVGSVRPASDLDGVYRIRLRSDKADESRREFRQAMIDIKCDVGPGNDYLRAGNFFPTLQEHFQRWVDSDYRWNNLLTESDLEDLRRRDHGKLGQAVLSYVLVSSVQHGISVPSWLQANQGNPLAVQALVDIVVNSSHRQPRLRAARALEAVDPDLLSDAIIRLQEAEADVPQTAWMLLEAARANSTAQFVAERAEKDWNLADWQVLELLNQFKEYPTRRAIRLLDSTLKQG